jgi:hypothetical protein
MITEYQIKGTWREKAKGSAWTKPARKLSQSEAENVLKELCKKFLTDKKDLFGEKK